MILLFLCIGVAMVQTGNAAALSSISCTNASVSGIVNDPCKVTLNAPAPSGGLAVSLSSNNAAVKVPATVTVGSGASSAGFTAAMSAVGSSQTAKLTATAAGVSATSSLSLQAVVSTMSTSATGLAFGNLATNTSAAQTLTLKSVGSWPVDIYSASVQGAGFSVSGATFPAKLQPGQSLALKVQFNPTAAGAVSGALTLSTNSSAGNTVAVSLSGTGTAASVSTMSISASSLAFGSVPTNTASTQSLTLNSVGTWPLDINSVSIQGAGFSVSGGTFPAKLQPGQSLSLKVQFNPTTAGAASGTLTISTNSSTGNTVPVSLSGTGEAAAAQPAPSTGATYYLAPASAGGKDSNNGLSVGSPWLSPNHSLNCGDVIIALASTGYDSANFNSGHWGAVSCSTGNNVAWLQCESFDGCKISTKVEGMYVDRSYWGVQGWEVSVSGTNGFCFGAAPNYSHPANTHHVIFANNIANGCMGGGFVSFNVGTAGTDYLTIVGNIAYNTARGSDQCYSGISIYEPVQSDSAPGTHLYVAGNFVWGIYQPNPCAGGKPFGGDGIIFDTLDGSQHPMPSAYVAQAVAANNILFGNGGYGIEMQNNVAGSVHAPIYLSHNTVWGNEGNSAMASHAVFCGEVFLNSAYNVQETSNLVATKAQNACVNNPEYALSAYDVDTTVSATNNFAFGYNNQNTFVGTGRGFTYNSNNIVGQDPKFSNAYVPGAPACGGSSNVPDCMAFVINNFTPTNNAAISTGYQRADSTPVADPLFPEWVCSANLPAGLTPMACKGQ